MKNYQLIGEQLGHSFSKEIHEAFGEYCYDLREIACKDLEHFMLNTELDGFNVTIPYKQAVIPLLDGMSDNAKSIGAVNTIVKENEKLFGYNTDILGMEYMLNRAEIDISNKKILILGSGGTCKTAMELARQKNAKKVEVVSRSGSLNYYSIYDHTDAEIIINTTPVGMYPNNYDSLIDLSRFENLSGVVDVIYNPLMSRLLYQAKVAGINYTNGLPMLVAQAKYSRDIFMGNKIDDSIIEKVIKKIKKKLTNIVLIGMPGSGKTAVGKRLAEILEHKFYDSDDIIEERSGKPIIDVFASKGEEYFRKAEADVVSEIGVKNQIIFATGGGVVKTKTNDFAMQQNSYVVYIKRSLEELARKNRPLSKDMNSLKKIYRERESSYLSWSDFIVKNDSSIEACADKILEKFNECIES